MTGYSWRRGGPRTLIGWVNFLIFQWFWFRIARGVDVTTGRLVSFGLVLPVVPMTGWNGNYHPSWCRAVVLWKTTDHG